MDEKDHAILAERGGGEIHQSTITYGTILTVNPSTSAKLMLDHCY